MSNTGNIPRITGGVDISYSVKCPHCGEFFFNTIDTGWFRSNIGHTIDPDSDYEAECDSCGWEFIIEGFCV